MRAVALVLLVVSGCSWLFMHKPTDVVDPKTGPTCDDSAAMPVLDTLEVVADAVILVALASSSGSSNQGSQMMTGLDGATVGETIADAIIFGAAAASGYHWAAVCKEQRAAFEVQARKQDETQTRRLGAALVLRDPSDDPAKTWSYWCGGRNLVCTADQSRCHGECAERTTAWCAVYKTSDDATEFSCAPDRDICLEHVKSFGSRNGVHDWGECVEQKARLARPGAAILANPVTAPVGAPVSAPATGSGRDGCTAQAGSGSATECIEGK